jgi:hypothetical protein
MARAAGIRASNVDGGCEGARDVLGHEVSPSARRFALQRKLWNMSNTMIDLFSLAANTHRGISLARYLLFSYALGITIGCCSA